METKGGEKEGEEEEGGEPPSEEEKGEPLAESGRRCSSLPSSQRSVHWSQCAERKCRR